MSALFTLVSLAMIRYKSVVLYERSWHRATNDRCFTSRVLQQIWGTALVLSIPPMVGLGRYVKDIGSIRYVIDCFTGFGTLIETFNIRKCLETSFYT